MIVVACPSRSGYLALMVSVKQIDRLRICCTYMISAAKKNSDVDVPKKYFSYDYGVHIKGAPKKIYQDLTESADCDAARTTTWALWKRHTEASGEAEFWLCKAFLVLTNITIFI